MEHWKTTRPVEWLDLDYEALVTDVEGQSRRLIAYLGLPWDPACLSFYKNRRVVRTPSLVQVAPAHSRRFRGNVAEVSTEPQPALRGVRAAWGEDKLAAPMGPSSEPGGDR